MCAWHRLPAEQSTVWLGTTVPGALVPLLGNPRRFASKPSLTRLRLV